MIRYIELKSGYTDDGPAWIGRVKVSRTGQTVYFNGHAFKRARGGYGRGNHIDIVTRESYWISGVKKDGHDRHWAGKGKITIESAVVAEYLLLTERTELDPERYTVSDAIVPADPARFYDLENKPL